MLAGQQVAALSAMPKELQTPCDLRQGLRAGALSPIMNCQFPLMETGVRTGELVDFQTDFNAVPGLSNCRRVSAG